MFVLRVVQPGLAGLMDGSVSTLAPLRRGLRDARHHRRLSRGTYGADVSAGISMVCRSAERRWHDRPRHTIVARRRLRIDDLPRRDRPHVALPDPYFTTATIVAVAVVAVELLVISYIRNHYMDTPFLSAAFQVIVGGLLAFLTSILIGIRDYSIPKP